VNEVLFECACGAYICKSHARDIVSAIQYTDGIVVTTTSRNQFLETCCKEEMLKISCMDGMAVNKVECLVRCMSPLFRN
jgi:hypothetical protein